jgi:enoyl-CoA hydratase
MSKSGQISSSLAEVGRILSERQGHVFLITIDRPEKYNGFTPAMMHQLAAAYTAFEMDSEARCAVLRANGPNFTAGLQLSEFDAIDGDLFPAGEVQPHGLKPPFRTKPVIAAVKGICFTLGIELMLSCDVVVAEEDTRFSQLEVKRGIMAMCGATSRFVERAGWGDAMRWLLTGEEFGPEEARRMHFVQEIVPKGNVEARALELAESIARQAPLAVQATLENARTYVHDGPDAATQQIHQIGHRLMQSEDYNEGIQSFLERRDGDFKGI